MPLRFSDRKGQEVDLQIHPACFGSCGTARGAGANVISAGQRLFRRDAETNARDGRAPDKKMLLALAFAGLGVVTALRN
jgi:hypothetical protein